MRYILLFWALPLGLFWAWYFLSAADVGLLFFTTELHERVFLLYGLILGMEPESLPPLVARACIVDTAIIFGIFGFRRRRDIAGWAREARLRYFGEKSAPSA